MEIPIFFLTFVSANDKNNKEMEKYHATESYYGDKLDNIRQEIIGQVKSVIERLGGRICARHYHDFEDMERNTYFEVDYDGYGRELFLDTIFTDEQGEIEVTLHDGEDGYNPYWSLSDFTATDSLYLLSELEDIVELVEEEGCPIVTDYDEDYEPDEE